MDCVLDRRRKLRAHNTDLVGRWKVLKGCCKCGYNKHQSALHLNHIDPTTKYKSGSAKAYDAGWSKDRIKEELVKCEVLCANCHAIETHDQSVLAGIRRTK